MWNSKNFPKFAKGYDLMLLDDETNSTKGHEIISVDDLLMDTAYDGFAYNYKGRQSNSRSFPRQHKYLSN